MLPLFLFLVLLPFGDGHAQISQPKVNVSFWMDGKPKPSPHWIEFRKKNGDLIDRVRIINHSFVPPPEALAEPVTLTIKFQKRTMTFCGMYPAKYSVPWKIGIDTPPIDLGFDDEDGTRNADAKEIWYIESGETVAMTVIPKKRNSKK
jgi:hypothetical protein